MDIKQLVSNHSGFDKFEQADLLAFSQFLDSFPQEMWAVRENAIGHLTSSAIILNKDKTKMLMGYHKIFDCWAWFGGHADGDLDLHNVCLKELEEETGIGRDKFTQIIENGTPLTDIAVLAVNMHEKKGKVVNEHIHYNLATAFQVDENEELSFRPDEHNGIDWVEIKELLTNDKYKQEKDYIMHIYKRLLMKSGVNID